MSAEELKIEPGLTITQEIVNSKRQMDTVEHKAFIEGVTSISEKLFSSPEVEAEMTQAKRKHKREAQLSTFNKLQHLASAKMLQLDKFIHVEIGVQYKEFVEKVKGVEFSIQNCLPITLEHWTKVRETELTMSKPHDKAGGPLSGETSEES